MWLDWPASSDQIALCSDIVLLGPGMGMTSTAATQPLDLPDCDALKRNASIPFNMTADGVLVYKKCVKYNVSGVEFQPHLDPSQ